MNAKPTGRRQQCGKTEAKSRLAHAKAFLLVADLVSDDPAMDAWVVVCAGDAVLAGIAASDAITCGRIAERHRGQDHNKAVTVLREALGDHPESRKLTNAFQRLLAIKDESHYGLRAVSESSALAAVKWARILVEWADKNLT